MITPPNLKTLLLENNNNSNHQNFRQLVLLNENIELVGSDDYIFSTQQFENVFVGKWFPFIESILDNLREIKIGEEELIFSRVESPAVFLPGSYDFSFCKIEIEMIPYIRWSIYDYTSAYNYLTQYQQLKNEKDIYRQKLEYRDQQIQSIGDLLSR